MSDAEKTAALLPLGQGVRIVCAHAAGIVALDKPAGIAAHPNAPGDKTPALLDAPYDSAGEFYFFKCNDNSDTKKIYLLNRIDSPTSGLILVATDEAVALAVKKLFCEKEVSKTYFAAVKGARVFPEKGIWRDNLAMTRTGGVVRAVAVKGAGIPAISEYRRVCGDKGNAGLSLLQLSPKTGRTHQLRVQCAAHNHPILGDQTYGDFAFNRRLKDAAGSKRLFLHSAAISFQFPWRGTTENFSAESELPAEFRNLFGEITLSATTPASVPAMRVSDKLTVRINIKKKRH